MTGNLDLSRRGHTAPRHSPDPKRLEHHQAAEQEQHRGNAHVGEDERFRADTVRRRKARKLSTSAVPVVTTMNIAGTSANQTAVPSARATR